MIGALAWAEVSGRFVLGTSVALGAVALLMLPGAVVALVGTRRVEPPEPAGKDVWWIASRGRVPDADSPLPELRRVSGQYPDGVVVQPRRLGDPSYPALP